MKPLLQRISPPLRGALLLLLLLLLSSAGCSVLLPDSDFRVTLVNRTDRPLIYSATTSDVATRIYMGYTFPVDRGTRESAAFLQPGESIRLTREEIEGEYESGETIVFFLYEVNGDTATWKGTLPMTRKDLEQRHFRLEITQLPVFTVL